MSSVACGVSKVTIEPDGSLAVPDLSIDRRFTSIFNVENACASASTAFNAAWTAIKAGTTDVALAVGVDKMYDADKARSFAIFDGALDVHRTEETFAGLMALGEGVEPGAVYRYRLRVNMLNPLFQRGQLRREQQNEHEDPPRKPLHRPEHPLEAHLLVELQAGHTERWFPHVHVPRRCA